MMLRQVLAALAVLGGTAMANASDADALRLADETPETVTQASEWRGFVEAAFGDTRWRSDGATLRERRLSLGLRHDGSLSPPWRAVFAHRLDVKWPAQDDHDSVIHTVQEAYLSAQPTQSALLDIGRINARHGVAMAYNPTDYFRGGALRSIISIDPESLKENRQGSVMLRGQRLWEGGAMTLLYSPRLGGRASSDGFSLDWGATNPRHRALMAWSQKLTETLSPQFLVYREEGLPAQFGFNLTGLFGRATVAYLEGSGGRSPSLLSQALQQQAPAAWRNRLAGGLTCTAPGSLSLTAEMQYNGAGLGRNAWRALREGTPTPYGLYRAWAQTAQEPPTRQSLFFRASWPDALIPRVDLSTMLNVDLVDSSRRAWLELRYRGRHLDTILQGYRNDGHRLSTYGALPESVRWQMAVKAFF